MATQSGVTLRVQVEGASLSASAGINGAISLIARTITKQWAQGTSANGVDKVYAAAALALTTTPTDLDLAGGSNVKDPASQTDQTFTKLHCVIVHNTGDNAIVLGGDANSVPLFDAAADSITIPVGGLVVLQYGPDGIAVTASTGDILQLAAAASTSTADVIIWGR